MKLILKKSDCTKIAKIFALNDLEKEELLDYADNLRREQNAGFDEYCSETKFALFNSLPFSVRGSYAKDLQTAATAAVIYLAYNIQNRKRAENKPGADVNSLSVTSYELSILLGVTYTDMEQFFINIYCNPKFNKFVHTAQACNLDYLEITLK